MNTITLNREYGKWLNTIPWDYFTTLSYKWDVKAKQCRRVMDNLTKELVESKRDFGMFWVAEWHKSGTSTHTHLLLKGEVTDLVDYYWKSNNYGDNRGIKHLAYDSSKGACYYVSKYYDRNVDNDIFVRTIT